MRTPTSTAALEPRLCPRIGRTKASSSRNFRSCSVVNDVWPQIETHLCARRRHPGGGRCIRRGRRARSANHTTQRLVRSDPRALRGRQRAIRQGLESEDRRRRHYQPVARRLGQTGPRRDRRARGRRGDARPRRRHRRDRREGEPASRGLANTIARQQLRPTLRPSCCWCAKAIRRTFTIGTTS